MQTTSKELPNSNLQTTNGLSIANPNFSPDDDQLCVLDLINLLGSNEENKFYPGKFQYKSIGSKQINKNLILTDEEQILTEKISETINALELIDLQEQLYELRKDKHILQFTNNDKLKGFPFTDLIWNENRPNLSIRVKYFGNVNIPENNFGIPNMLSTFIYKTYTFIKDGIVNIKEIPVTLSVDTFKSLKNKGLLNDELESYLLDISKIPVINKKIANEVSAIETFKNSYELLKQKAYHKVFNAKLKELFPKISQGYIDLYGIEGEQWLKSLGITEVSGFNPNTIKNETNETYDAIELVIKISGETFPTLKILEEKIKPVSQKIIEISDEIIGLQETIKVSKEDNNLDDQSENDLNKKIKQLEAKIKKLSKIGTEQIELNLGESFMNEALQKFNTIINTNLYKNTNNIDFLKTWLKIHDQETVKNSRKYIIQQAKIKFALILNQSWFSEFSSKSENTMTLEIDGKNVEFTANLKDIKIEI